MAVYTSLDDAEFIEILDDYTLGGFVSAKGIAEGVENSNYLLETTSGRFVATVFEKRMDPAELPFFVQLTEHLVQRGVPCPQPIKDKQGKVIREVKGRPFILISFLQGGWPKVIKNQHCEQLGSQLAAMHLAVENFPQTRANAMSLPAWKALYTSTCDRADETAPGLSHELQQAMEELETRWPANLPSGIIHADLFPDNVFFENNQLSGVLDFYFACDDFFMYDLAICLNAWCFEERTAFNMTKARHLLKAYNAKRTISEAERNALPVLCAGAAMRFLLSRLYDWQHQVEGAIVEVKDPMEYVQKLRFHRQVRSVGEYGL